MKRYLIKANFFNYPDLEGARSELVRRGIPLSNIDHLSIRKSRGKHLSFGRVDRGADLAIKFLPIGFIIGAIVYISSIFSSTEGRGSTVESLSLISLFDMILVTLVFGYIGMIVGYFFGKKSVIHTIEYSKKSGTTGGNVLMVSTDEDFRLTAESILKSYKPASLDIIDSKFEIEVGLREQKSA